jgi:hypothetical protein
MPGLDPGIHSVRANWIAGSSPAMTNGGFPAPAPPATMNERPSGEPQRNHPQKKREAQVLRPEPPDDGAVPGIRPNRISWGAYML